MEELIIEGHIFTYTVSYPRIDFQNENLFGECYVIRDNNGSFSSHFNLVRRSERNENFLNIVFQAIQEFMRILDATNE